MIQFNAEQYWNKREVKVWVVVVTNRQDDSQTMYIRSRTKQGAGSCAKENSFLKGTLFTNSRLATPVDLGCVETGEPA